MDERVHSGWTLIEVLVVLGVISIIATMSIIGWQTLSDRLSAVQSRQQLMQDLHTARVIAMERQESLTISRLQGCAWQQTSTQNDWSCGWQITRETSSSPNLSPTVLVTRIERPLRVSAFPATPLQINSRGDLVGVGVRWQFQLIKDAQASWLICLNAASRMRAVSGVTCS
jgi:prepilin-type N-terminal cleavage/methylation domain-containing protein